MPRIIESKDGDYRAVELEPASYVGGPRPTEDFYKFRVDGSEVLEDIRTQLRGFVWDSRKEEWVKVFEPLLDEEGINSVLYVVYSCGVNKNTVLGNLSRDEINFKCSMIKRQVAKLIFKRARKWGLSRDHWDAVLNSIVNPIHSALSRSDGGLEARQLSQHNQRHEVHTKMEGKDPGFMSKLIPKFN